MEEFGVSYFLHQFLVYVFAVDLAVAKELLPSISSLCPLNLPLPRRSDGGVFCKLFDERPSEVPLNLQCHNQLFTSSMPKRIGEEVGGPNAKRTRTGAVNRKKKNKVSPLPLLDLSVTRWRYVDDTEGSHPLISVHHIKEPATPTWREIFCNHKRSLVSCDLALETKNGVQIPAHSLVLRIRIPFFENLLQSKLVSGDANTRTAPTVITLDWLESGTLEEVVDFTYFATTADAFSNAEIYNIFKAALHMGWDELEHACLEQFQQRLCVANCLKWLEWSVQNHQETVKNRAASFAATCIDQLHDYPHEFELKQLSAEAHLAITRLI